MDEDRYLDTWEAHLHIHLTTGKMALKNHGDCTQESHDQDNTKALISIDPNAKADHYAVIFFSSAGEARFNEQDKDYEKAVISGG